MKSRFLVGEDSGKGSIWIVVRANGKDEIHQRCPTLQVADTRPDWMTDDEYQKILDWSDFDLDCIPDAFSRWMLKPLIL